ncbi:glycosyltransferase family 2 protein [Herbiconiux sp. CPCC 205763]|uniref:Glycosyltransferase family 2 protein n=1 Tax=Herbiconiux aconitum TaxID=2970913 RepID=A0ABT2GNK6_9MICO|nr:glycosyltransferase family 2 protein [Herbiconiux aconitum]MCS5717182.1 glycosyltransferase family 2 protein [Herbiconiux aconitum]
MSTKSLASPARKRQLGAERSTEPLSTVHAIPSDTKITWGRLAIVITVAAWITYVVSTVVRQFLNNGTESFRFTTEAISYLVVVTFLTFSALMYLVARQGALQRFRDHVRVPRAELDKHFSAAHQTMTVLVPSYSEEPAVVRKTLWSAALQEYPSLRVVLLLDDPPFPSDPGVAAQLEASRRIASDIADDLRAPRDRAVDALLSFEGGQLLGDAVHASDVRRLAGAYSDAADWLQTMADHEERTDHVDTFFVEQVLGALAGDLRVTADALDLALDVDESPSAERMLELHRRLVWIFSAELETFERKKFASLSHEANKAMNLNSYIGLMGGRFRREQSPDGVILRPVDADETADAVPTDYYEVPDAGYLLTLDADSLLLREYCLRLVYFLEQPHNERVAVTQTPYSSFRGAPTRIERLAGATTDLQHIQHQGMTHYGATFWVGANAVIRKPALEDIVEIETVGGFEVRRYVQDRTVIEDTESSVDLGLHGWTLVNYPERLSYSATPPDFGSLIVQRRRWANGGLLILPKFWRQIRARQRAGHPVGIAEILLRVNYMASITWASFGLVFLLAYPYDSRLLSPVVLIAALPYFIAMGSDLRYSGYTFTDIFRIYGFNLILLPVNLAGVFKSLEQAISSKKIPFARTPKVRNRTAAPLLYVVAPYAIVVFSVLTFWRDFGAQNWGNAAFAALNASLASWAILANIGIGPSLVDVWLGLTKWLYVDRKPAAVASGAGAGAGEAAAGAGGAAAAPSLALSAGAPPASAAGSASQPELDFDAVDWRSVLYHGNPADPATAVSRSTRRRASGDRDARKDRSTRKERGARGGLGGGNGPGAAGTHGRETVGAERSAA